MGWISGLTIFLSLSPLCKPAFLIKKKSLKRISPSPVWHLHPHLSFLWSHCLPWMVTFLLLLQRYCLCAWLLQLFQTRQHPHTFLLYWIHLSLLWEVGIYYETSLDHQFAITFFLLRACCFIILCYCLLNGRNRSIIIQIRVPTMTKIFYPVFMLQFFNVMFKNPLATVCSKVTIFPQGYYLCFSDSKNVKLRPSSLNGFLSAWDVVVVFLPYGLPVALCFFFLLSYFFSLRFSTYAFSINSLIIGSGGESLDESVDSTHLAEHTFLMGFPGLHLGDGGTHWVLNIPLSDEESSCWLSVPIVASDVMYQADLSLTLCFKTSFCPPLLGRVANRNGSKCFQKVKIDYFSIPCLLFILLL